MNNRNQPKGRYRQPIAIWESGTVGRRRRWRRPGNQSGFTLVELLTAMAIVGTLALVVAPGWLSLRSTLALNTAQGTVFEAMRQAQAQATRSHIVWQASFRESGNLVQWTTHLASATPAIWQSLTTGVHIDPAQTTLAAPSGVYRVQFDQQGRVTGQLGRLSLMTTGSKRRCVFTSTLIGALRKASDKNCA